MKSTGSLYSADRVYIQQEALVLPKKTVPLGQAVIAKQSDHTPIALPPKAQQENYTLLTLSTPQSPTGTPQAFLEKKAAQVSQPKQISQKLEEAEDSDSEDSDLEGAIEHSSLFLSYYIEDRKTALDYLSRHKNYINFNYDDGAVMSLAIEKRDREIIKFLFDKITDESLLDKLGDIAQDGDTECTKLFMDFLEQRNIDYSSIKITTAYDNHNHIKDLFDKRITNAQLLIKSTAEKNFCVADGGYR